MIKRIRKILIGVVVIISVLLVLTFTIIKVPSVEDKGDSIRVLSYNIKNAASNMETFDDRKLVIINQIKDYNPDFIGFQEADYAWMSVYGGLPEYLEEYSFVGVGREDGETSGEYAPIFYLKDKYEVIDSGTFWLSETPEEVSIGWDASTYRIVTWARFRDKETNEEITHYNTHFDHIGEEAQFNSAIVLKDTVEQCETPFFITGDFNVLQGSKPYKEITNSDKISDSKKVASDSMSHGTVNWFKPLNVKFIPPIDFVFVSTDIIVHTYRVDNTYWFNDLPVSDHYPVIVDIDIK